MMAAEAFEHFDAGVHPVDVVKKTRWDPRAVEAMHRQWVTMRGGYVVTAAVAKEIASLPWLMGARPICTGEQLLKNLHHSVPHGPCTRCEEEGRPGSLAEVCGECARSMSAARRNAGRRRRASCARRRTTKEDIALASRLCHEVLGRSLDELPPQTRRLLGVLDAMVRERCRELGVDREDFRFSRREVRDRAQWGNTQVKVHLGRLVEMEYVVAHRGRQGQGYVYELAYGGEGQDGAPFLPGLLDVGALDAPAPTTPTSRGAEGDIAGAGRPSVGGMSAGGRSGGSSPNAGETGSSDDDEHDDDEAAHRGRMSNGASYVEIVAARGV